MVKQSASDAALRPSIPGLHRGGSVRAVPVAGGSLPLVHTEKAKLNPNLQPPFTTTASAQQVGPIPVIHLFMMDSAGSGGSGGKKSSTKSGGSGSGRTRSKASKETSAETKETAAVSSPAAAGATGRSPRGLIVVSEDVLGSHDA